jgi:PAS domain S-box-containing protein
MKSNKSKMNWDDSDRDTIEAILNVALDSNFSSLMLTGAADGYPIKYVNPAFTELTGYTAEEVVGKNPGLLQGPKTDRDLLKELRDKIDGGQSFHGRTVNYRKDGSEFTMEWKVYPINNAKNETTHYLAVQRAA